MRNLIIDTDGGIDDALALAMVINSPHFNILAITTTYGNVSVEGLSGLYITGEFYVLY